jgi:hypothetical protein
MNDTKTNSPMMQVWVALTDVNGRTRLEARWIPDSRSGTPAHVGHAA